jgi:hypothetical protein
VSPTRIFAVLGIFRIVMLLCQSYRALAQALIAWKENLAHFSQSLQRIERVDSSLMTIGSLIVAWSYDERVLRSLKHLLKVSHGFIRAWRDTITFLVTVVVS